MWAASAALGALHGSHLHTRHSRTQSTMRFPSFRVATDKEHQLQLYTTTEYINHVDPLPACDGLHFSTGLILSPLKALARSTLSPAIGFNSSRLLYTVVYICVFTSNGILEHFSSPK